MECDEATFVRILATVFGNWEQLFQNLKKLKTICRGKTILSKKDRGMWI